MMDVRISGLVLVPRQKRKVPRRLALIKAEHISQRNHPPVVGLELDGAADITNKRLVPRHTVTPRYLFGPPQIDAAKGFSSLQPINMHGIAQKSFAEIL
jgi:hypothetical protein